jgi:alpha-beta hydrolase superfamily lysophospholipase
MQIAEFIFKSQDQTNIYACKWSPDVKTRGVILLVHGLGEHIGRYHHVIDKFINAGYVIVGFDHPGHGKSEGKRGYIRSFDDYLAIIDHLVTDIKSVYSGLPLFIYGHSLGSEIVLYYCLKRNPDVKGAIVTSPGIGVGDQSKSKVALVKLIAKFAPRMVIDNGLDLDALSRDPEVVQKYKDDPLVHSKVGVMLGLGMIDAGNYILENGSDFPNQLLLLQGADDRIVSVDATRQFANLGSPNVSYIEWKGGYHELHNEPDKESVLNTIVHWISERS